MKFEFSNDARKAVGSLDPKMAGRIIKAVVELPGKGDIKALQGNHHGQFRLRVGDWRVIYTISDDNVLIADILPRGEAYKQGGL
jgi:mRNA interferase RelE/StbE